MQNGVKLDLVRFSVEEIPFMDAFKDFRAMGMSEEKFRILLNKLGAGIIPGTYPPLFYLLTDDQLRELQEIRNPPSVFSKLSSSQVIRQSRDEVVTAYRALVDADDAPKIITT